jgi:hypothetical protein
MAAPDHGYGMEMLVHFGRCRPGRNRRPSVGEVRWGIPPFEIEVVLALPCEALVIRSALKSVKT